MFAISSIKATKPLTYTINDTLGEPVQGTFYEQELQLSEQEFFSIERVLKKKKNQVRVKWKGYSDAFNSSSMNISKQYAWRPAADCRENNHLLPQYLRGMVIGKSGCGKTTVIFNLLLRPGWLNYNHLYGNSLHQQEYKVLRKGLDAGLSKQHISNLFNNQEALGDIYLVVHVMERYDSPYPSALDPTQKNMLLVDDCFLGRQNKAEAYYTRGRHNNCDRIYIAIGYTLHKIISDYLDIQFEKTQTLLSCSHKK